MVSVTATSWVIRPICGLSPSESSGSFDVVLEKSWLLSGCVSAFCRSRGQLGVPVENIVANPVYAARRRLKRARVAAGRWLAGRALRGAPLIIAETEFLKKEIAQFWRVASERIAVVDLGVDRELFRPIEQAAARHDLSLEAGKTVLMYVGVLDYTHDLEPVMRALGKRRDPSIELHIVGNGERADEYRAIAARRASGRRFPWQCRTAKCPRTLPQQICALLRITRQLFPRPAGRPTMKIPEYLSMGRAVVSVPSGRIRSLVTSGVNGFLFEQPPNHRQERLALLPSRERLRAMGEAAASVKLTSWDDTVRAYLDLCRRELDSSA